MKSQNHGGKGSLAGGSGVAPLQTKLVPPTLSAPNMKFASHGNTKAPGVSIPQGKHHSKVAGKTPTARGNYL